MRNNSDERGAKLMNGSYDWKNYSVEADVQLLGQYGDAGLILRARNEEEGVDAYNGYFAGLRDLDDSVILGRADFGWREYHSVPVKPRVNAQTWYHLKFLATNAISWWRLHRFPVRPQRQRCVTKIVYHQEGSDLSLTPRGHCGVMFRCAR